MHMRHWTLVELAQYLDAELVGAADYPVSGISTLVAAQPHQVSFLANMKYASQLADCGAGAVIVHPDQAHHFVGNKLLLANPYLGYAKLSALFAPATSYQGIHPSAVVAQSASLAADVVVGPGVVIGEHVRLDKGVSIGPNCVIGDHCIVGAQTCLAANVTLYHGVILGQRNLIHSGAVLGADGFGFAKDGVDWVKIHQLGGVVTGDDVEIGAGTTIDRGALDDTRIGNGVKLDNQVQIAHNVVLGDYTAIAGCTAIAGSTILGKNCTIAGACGITGHLHLADGVHVTAMSLVTHSIKEPGAYSSGTGLDDNHKWRRNAARFKQLDQMAKRLKQLEQELQKFT
ncbi:MAG: UDP-3-O-(3-hydroxymyristoyl)glucosamine N-acyltransferase [Gammaproteobacteria bacterium]|jgi:UDP-3-O-[3-hydroxymyristoyl] glucosamine N-acyltransferase|nr:UDP-3-O-(3-hydroxymyristoyl)glucosamine N-acyltransferase [Gammaproteobacteria bacterium]